MRCMSRTGRMFGAVLACGILLISLLYAEEPVIRIQDPKPQQPQVQDTKRQELKSQEPRLQDPKAKGPKNEETTSKPAGSLILAVKLALMADQRLFHYPIDVESKGQEVMLAGKVSNEAEKLAAAEVAQRVEGVKSVINKLEVVEDLHQDMARKRDQIITGYVKERFKRSKTLESAGFDVKTENGVVELSGKTRFQVIALEAAEAARQIPGVKAVKTDAVRLEGTE